MANSVQFVKERPYRDVLKPHHSRVYEKLINRFKAFPEDLEEQDYGSMREMAGFLILQGVVVEILELEYGDDKTYYALDVSYEDGAHNLTYLSDGSGRSLQFWLIADSYEDAITGITAIMLDAK